MTIFVTGAAGFIGYSLVARLLNEKPDCKIIGIDSVNSYYSVQLKRDRLQELRKLDTRNQFQFFEQDLKDAEALKNVWNKHTPDYVIHLAAQAGVRYSLENPSAYIDANIIGTLNILECCRFSKPKHLVMASSSSVYGANTTLPYSENQMTDSPVSLYAATKKSNELMGHTYSHLFSLPITCLRFFTVYGPWGRPDMAYFSFTKKILAGETIELHNNGHHRRDFTYIDDILQGLNLVWPNPPKAQPQFRVYNIGNSESVELKTFVSTLENALGKKAILKNVEHKPGDVLETFADVSALKNDFGYKSTTRIDQGLQKFVNWYKSYYQV